MAYDKFAKDMKGAASIEKAEQAGLSERYVSKYKYNTPLHYDLNMFIDFQTSKKNLYKYVWTILVSTGLTINLLQCMSHAGEE